MSKQSGVKEAQPKDISGSTLAKILLGSALAGFGIRGTVGLSKLFKRRVSEREEELERQKLQPKAAEVMEKEALDPYVGTMLGTLLGGGGAYGGWRLADYLFDKRRLEDAQRRVRRAKEEYEQLLLGRDTGPGVELRLPKTAEFMERAAKRYEETGETKQAAGIMDILGWLPLAGTSMLTALVASAALSSYAKAKSASPEERKLEAFRKRPRYRSVPPRAVLSQARPSIKQEEESATALPKLKEEERMDEPYKAASVASVLLSA